MSSVVVVLSPMRTAIGASSWGGKMMITVLIKWLSLRFLGGKGYERIIVTLMSGIIVSYGFQSMLGVISTTLWRP